MNKNPDIMIYILIFLVLGSLVLPQVKMQDEPVQEVQETEAPTELTTQPILIEFEATAYCPCEKCCGKYAHSRKNGVRGASGMLLESGKSIAVDTKVIPYGSILVINGKEYIAADCGGNIKGNRIDFYFDSHEEALKFGRQTVYGYIKEVQE